GGGDLPAAADRDRRAAHPQPGESRRSDGAATRRGDFGGHGKRERNYPPSAARGRSQGALPGHSLGPANFGLVAHRGSPGWTEECARLLPETGGGSGTGML